MLTGKSSLLFVSFLVFTLFLPGFAAGQDESPKGGVEYFIDLYGWMPNIYGESATNSDIELDLDDILDDLQFGIMAMGGVKKDKWEFSVDVIYMDLEDDSTQTGNLLGVVPVDIYTDVELQAWVVTPKVAYNLIDKDRFKMNILAGARYLYLDVDFEVDVNGARDHELSISDSSDFWDAIIGISGEVNLSEKWFMPYYADIGTGDTDSTYNLFGGFGYRFSRVDVMAGWRYMRWNFDNNPALKNLYISGPIMGVKIRF